MTRVLTGARTGLLASAVAAAPSSRTSTTSRSPVHGDTLLAAINEDNEIALVKPGGSHRTVLTGADGLEGPTSLAVRGNTAYIA
ncbi:hypothetical protein [Streptomyces poonensis]|uniref:Uncharacterized protein n=1 Tax=Streptomyces poonensis TaxID=68255 RepID=A0A918UG02_9ACTN|nr:hypothetical protein [Streptomyces poonensis]GGZ03314.1 hypothetical protein GCM10010365_22600 [Streptomyces poonensis]GLJ92980.1 hypothetical protein GCM10017589_55910 [Streptomyces poonensis]